MRRRCCGATPALLEHELWDLIALGGGRADTLTAADAAGAGWGDAILAGVAPRDRVLDALLAALGGDLVAYRDELVHEALARARGDVTPSARRGRTPSRRC